jgi:hypothetical protein
MARETKSVKDRLSSYRRKYYSNELLKGTLITVIILLVFYLGATFLDFTFRFGGILRALLFFGFLLLSVWLMITRIVIPLLKLLNIIKGIDDFDSAKKVGGFFPEVRDKLLNLLQLQKLAGDSSLIKASIDQKSEELGNVEFSKAVSLKSNRRYASYLSIPAIATLLVLLVSPQLFTTSTPRIINFTEQYLPVAPFSFILQNENLTAFRNEDFTLNLQLSGEAFPEDVYLVHKDLKYKMNRISAGVFEFTFDKIQSDKRVYFEGSGFSSEDYLISVVQRPNLKNFNIELDYPAYTGRKDERISNIGNLEIPEGTSVQWLFNAINTREVSISFGESDAISLNASGDLFDLKKSFYRDTQYEVFLKNEFSTGKDPIIYNIKVIRDQYPGIVAGSLTDTMTYRSINLAGNISDDYGISKLELKYHIENSPDTVAINIPIDQDQISQGFYYQWRLDSLGIAQGSRLSYYLEVFDNDRVNGSKSSKSATYRFNMPDKNQIKAEINKAGDQTEERMENLVERAKDLEELIEELEQRLKSKTDMNWQDEQLLKELLKEREAIQEEIKKLSEEYKDLQRKKDQFTNQEEKTQEKADQLDELIEDMMDEETREMFEELKKLLEEKYNKNEVEQQLDQMKRNQKDLTNDLERTMELFKRLQLEQKLEEAIQDLEELSEKQNELSEETKSSEKTNEELSEKQDEVNKEFDDFQKQMEEIQEMNQDLKNPEPMRDISEENNSIQELQEQIKQDLQQGERQNAQQKQNRSSQKMKQLSQQMQQMQSGMELMMMQENLDNLRQILNNLVKLSFDQEELMTSFREVNQSDPRFIELAQEQLKLKDDAKVIEDSLMSLASRVQQISSYATREVTEMNRNLEASIEAIRDRKKPIAVSNQQLAMTSINNLALMLDNTLSDMMSVMADAMGMSQNRPQPSDQKSLGEMQMQLNDGIEELQQSGKSGRELSEELAKLAAEQERIRRALQEMQEKYGQQEGSMPGGDDIARKMQQTEMDLVNKRITQQTIRRQKDILTRLLEAEDALRERDLDEEREGETALDQYENELPKAFEEYFKSKQKEIELLKTVPPRLYPYYKKEVNDYFERLRGK